MERKQTAIGRHGTALIAAVLAAAVGVGGVITTPAATDQGDLVTVVSDAPEGLRAKRRDLEAARA